MMSQSTGRNLLGWLAEPPSLPARQVVMPHQPARLPASPRKQEESVRVTVAHSLHPTIFNEKIAETWPVRIDLISCSRPVAACALDGLIARADAARIAGSKQGMGGARACPALRCELDHHDARYRT